ncbi:hypothetical protein FS837_002163 [Tulasnella sp. UAMH 9824]|nr:hypothetical protein FS837_002163 [Tulasnella sp. UAMH 9824]
MQKKFTTDGSTEDEHIGDDYFIHSGDEIRYFLEEDAVGPDAKLNRPRKELALSKIGHGAAHENDVIGSSRLYAFIQEKHRDRAWLSWLLGIAKGLDCLHSHNPPVVHGDLKPNASEVNILLSDQGEPLLADFGLSTIMGKEKTYKTFYRVGGSVPRKSPECIEAEFKSTQSDSYSFGTLAFMVLTGQLPYSGLTDTQVTIRVSNGNSPYGPVED